MRHLPLILFLLFAVRLQAAYLHVSSTPASLPLKVTPPAGFSSTFELVESQVMVAGVQRATFSAAAFSPPASVTTNFNALIQSSGAQGTYFGEVQFVFNYRIGGGSVRTHTTSVSSKYVVVQASGFYSEVPQWNLSAGLDWSLPAIGGTLRLRCPTPRTVWWQIGTSSPVVASLTDAWQEWVRTDQGLLVIRDGNASGPELYPAQALSGLWGIVSLDIPGQVAGTVSLTNTGPASTFRPKANDVWLGDDVNIAQGATYVWTVPGSVLTPATSGVQVFWWSSGAVQAAAPVVWDSSHAWHAAATVGTVDPQGSGRIQFNFVNQSGIGRNVKIKLGGVVMAEGTTGADGAFISTFVTVHYPQYNTPYEVTVDGVVVRSGVTPEEQVINPEFPMPGGYDILLTYTAPDETSPPITDPESPDFDPDLGAQPPKPVEGTPERSDYDVMRRAFGDALKDGNVSDSEGIAPPSDAKASQQGHAAGSALGGAMSGALGQLKGAGGAIGGVSMPTLGASHSLVIWSRPPSLGGDIALDFSSSSAQEWAARVRSLFLILVNLTAGWAMLAIARKAFV